MRCVTKVSHTGYPHRLRDYTDADNWQVPKQVRWALCRKCPRIQDWCIILILPNQKCPRSFVARPSLKNLRETYGPNGQRCQNYVSYISRNQLLPQGPQDSLVGHRGHRGRTCHRGHTGRIGCSCLSQGYVRGQAKSFSSGFHLTSKGHGIWVNLHKGPFAHLLKPLKINCLFWASTRVALACCILKVHTPKSTHFTEFRAFFGL